MDFSLEGGSEFKFMAAGMEGLGALGESQDNVDEPGGLISSVHETKCLPV